MKKINILNYKKDIKWFIIYVIPKYILKDKQNK